MLIDLFEIQTCWQFAETPEKLAVAQNFKGSFDCADGRFTTVRLRSG